MYYHQQTYCDKIGTDRSSPKGCEHVVTERVRTGHHRRGANESSPKGCQCGVTEEVRMDRHPRDANMSWPKRYKHCMSEKVWMYYAWRSAKCHVQRSVNISRTKRCYISCMKRCERIITNGVQMYRYWRGANVSSPKRFKLLSLKAWECILTEEVQT